MLSVSEEKSRWIKEVERVEDRLYLYSDAGKYRLEPKNARTIRVTFTQKDTFSQEEKPGVVCQDVFSAWDFREDEDSICLIMEHLQIRIHRATGSFSYLDGDANCLFRERERDSKILEEFTVYKLQEDSIRTEKVVTPDGVKEVVKESVKEPAGSRFHTWLHLEFADEEALYGLGQHEEGFGSLRGQKVYVHQANRKIAIPMLVSTRGYGILVDTYSPMIFNDTIQGSYLYTEADTEMDFYVMHGGTMDEVIRQYRHLTGKAALLPKWAFGYIQSQERYETQEEILQVASEYRKRGIGLDGIVLDWCSWEDNQWGQKTFDPERFPSPGEMIETLHREHVHFMLSIWPNMAEHTDNYREFKEQGLLLPGCTVYNALSEKGRALYWEQLGRGLLVHGVDAWWCDSSEPFTPEWNHKEQVEPAVMYGEYCRMVSNHLPADRMNAFGLYHAQGIYEGQRSQSSKRVVNLTRSAYTGQQRYGTILWSGDTDASWDTLKRQVAAGLHFCASGLPFWTVDIGAFFVKRGDQWFWKGEYPDTYHDPAYCELFVRWFQWGTFLPVFRGHGTDCRRELWYFENGAYPFYDALLAANRLRYELLPYIYSYAGLCWLKDQSMIRLLAFCWPKDREARQITDQYMFGNELMVCPVVEPLYYGKQRGQEGCYRETSRTEEEIPTRKVYLPAGEGWYDYRTDAYYQGGQWIETDAPLDSIPIFVKAGSILPRVGFAPSTEETEKLLHMHIYPGKDADFLLYEDDGETYAYEEMKYTLTSFSWCDKEGKLTCEQLHGEKEKQFGSREEKEILYEKALGTYDTRKVTKAAMQAGEYIIGDVKIHGTERERKNGNH